MTALNRTGRLSLAELGLEPVATVANPKHESTRDEPPRRVLGLEEALEAGVPLALIEETAWRTVQRQSVCEDGSLDVPAHVALALAPMEGGPPSVEGLRSLVLTAPLQSALRRALRRLAHFHRRGVPAADLVDAVFTRHPVVHRDLSGSFFGPGLPDGEYGAEWVWSETLRRASWRECDIVALAMVWTPSHWSPTGWNVGGYLVARDDAEERGWIAPLPRPS